ncbi:hypothetical protein Ddye_010267 [Dipteronia dyeriana]|uniref:Uncharacterized protein n=1 Tax=Dipteronia dyeriana TaxID=168575 RepID=A0AAD9XD64_9ROSI|nr:hypothetical protein Ddye_010267 [Dipteronia dyeriana]
MIHAIRSIRTKPPTIFLSPLSPCIARKTSAVRFRQATTMQSKRPEKSESTDKSQNPNKPTEKTGDVMSHSFGEGYATRSDEEGFGGTCTGSNQCFPTKDGVDKEIHENHPAYDKTQGSEVKEKEASRHQTDSS